MGCCSEDCNIPHRMTKELFLKTIGTLLKKYGFIRKGQHYYLNCENDISCVIGLQKSGFGDYYYMEYGFAIQSLNPKMPYPKFSELNINCGRIMIGQHEAIHYENICDRDLENELNHILPIFIDSGKKGVHSILKNYRDNICYIIGAKTAEYLGVDTKKFNVYPDSLWG